MGRMRLLAQGVALGYVVLPLWGVSLASFDTPPSYKCIASVYFSTTFLPFTT